MATTHYQGPFALGHIEKVPNALIWTTPDATPPTSSLQLNSEHLETRPVELGHLCITSTGYFYRCIDAANQEALVWEILADPAGTTAAHAALTGTAVHGLGTASTLTAGATGAQLVTAATVDAARGVLGLASITLPPRRLNHTMLTMDSLVTGSGSATNTANAFFDLDTGATANSTARLFMNNNLVMWGRRRISSPIAIDWQRQHLFVATVRVVTANLEGVCRLLFGRASSGGFGIIASGNYVAIEIQNDTITTGYVVKSGVVDTVALTPAEAGVGTIAILSNNGSVSFFKDGTLIGATTNGPNTSAQGSMSYEIENGATPAIYRVYLTPESECN